MMTPIKTVAVVEAGTMGHALAQVFSQGGYAERSPHLMRLRRKRGRDVDAALETLRDAKTIAVVGLDSRTGRVAYRIAVYLQGAGYRVIPVHRGQFPADEVLGEKAYGCLKDVPEHIDLVDVFVRSERHLSLDDLLRLVRKRLPEVGRTTGYRTLRLLQAAGLASELQLEGKSRFEREYKRQHHDHFICRLCGGIFEFSSPEIERLQEEVAAGLGFVISGGRVDVDVDDKGEVRLDFPPSDSGDAPRREQGEPVLSE